MWGGNDDCYGETRQGTPGPTDCVLNTFWWNISYVDPIDRASQAYCILTFADIHRQRADTDRSVPRYTAAIKMFRDIGDKFGLIQAQIGIAKSLARCEKYKDAMEYYRLAVGTCHDTENKVGLSLLSLVKNFSHMKSKSSMISLQSIDIKICLMQLNATRNSSMIRFNRWTCAVVIVLSILVVQLPSWRLYRERVQIS